MKIKNLVTSCEEPAHFQITKNSRIKSILRKYIYDLSEVQNLNLCNPTAELSSEISEEPTLKILDKYPFQHLLSLV